MIFAFPQCANEMWSHWNNTNMSFQQRITESNDAHNKLQSHLSKTMQEIYDQEKHIEALKKAIRDKGPPLKVVKYPAKVLIAHHFVQYRCRKLGWRLELTVQMLSFAEILLITGLLRRSIRLLYLCVFVYIKFCICGLVYLCMHSYSMLLIAGGSASREH